MDFQVWVKFFIAAWLIALSPGSGAVLSMSHGLSYGVRKTSVTVFGLQLGLILLLVIAGAGVGSIVVSSSFLFNAVKIIGAIYLIYLGSKQFLSRERIQLPGAEQATYQHTLTVKQRIMTGFLTNATNPKGILFMVAVLPSFINVQQPIIGQLVTMALTMVAIDTIVMHGYALSASLLRHFLSSPRASQTINRVFGLLLVGIGLGLFLVEPNAANG